MILAPVEVIVVHPLDVQGGAAYGVHCREVDARRALGRAAANLASGEGTVGSVLVDTAARGNSPKATEKPVKVVQPVVAEGGNRGGADGPSAAGERRLVHVDLGIAEVIEEDMGRAMAVDNHIRELRVQERPAYQRRSREGQISAN